MWIGNPIWQIFPIRPYALFKAELIKEHKKYLQHKKTGLNLIFLKEINFKMWDGLTRLSNHLSNHIKPLQTIKQFIVNKRITLDHN